MIFPFAAGTVIALCALAFLWVLLVVGQQQLDKPHPHCGKCMTTLPRCAECGAPQKVRGWY